MEQERIFTYAYLNARIEPMARGKFFEEPLAEALAENGFGEVSGGGTLQSKIGEIIHCGIDVDLTDLEQGVPFVCKFLTERGAPRGSKLSYESNGRKIELPFGVFEGLGIYLNGTDLPAEVYQQCDINVVMGTLDRLLGNRVGFKGYWQGPTETALYLYGRSSQGMRDAIAGFMAEYPLCQKARIESIA